MKVTIFSLKTEILKLLRLGSKLFHPIIADGEKFMLYLMKGNIAHSSGSI